MRHYTEEDRLNARKNAKDQLKSGLYSIIFVAILFAVIGLCGLYAEHRDNQKAQEEAAKMSQYNTALQACYQQYVAPYQEEMAADPYLSGSLAQAIQANTQSCQNTAKQYLR